MTISRESKISLDATRHYHCIAQCVRQAYLFGEHEITGQNYDHRKQWIVSRLRFLSYVFSIDLCAFAVLSTHYHVVLHVDKERAEGWTQKEVVGRWMQLYRGDRLVDLWLESPGALGGEDLKKVDTLIEKWRIRLYDISWFMRCVNERIACMANEEDNRKGRFWEGRFKSQALLDDLAIISCMAYVDLNPVRAGIANNLLDSDFTSMQRRLYDYKNEKLEEQEQALDEQATQYLDERIEHQNKVKEQLELTELPEAPLMPFDGSSHTSTHTALPFTREDYFQLVDATGRAIREDKPGYISDDTPKIIKQFGIEPNKWIAHVQNFEQRYANACGSEDKIVRYAERFNRKRGKGIRHSRKFYFSAKSSQAA